MATAGPGIGRDWVAFPCGGASCVVSFARGRPDDSGLGEETGSAREMQKSQKSEYRPSEFSHMDLFL